MVRRLEPLHANVGKRLVKSPRVYLRDKEPNLAAIRPGRRVVLLVPPDSRRS